MFKSSDLSALAWLRRVGSAKYNVTDERMPLPRFLAGDVCGKICREDGSEQLFVVMYLTQARSYERVISFASLIAREKDESHSLVSSRSFFVFVLTLVGREGCVCVGGTPFSRRQFFERSADETCALLRE